MKIFEGQNVPIKSWCNDPEQGAIDQAYELSKLPFIFKQVCLMPDTHQGYGMPVGGVIATKDVVIVNAVGYDIGCGMCAMRTSLTDITVDQLKAILGGSKDHKGGIRGRIPVGFNHHKKKQNEISMPQISRTVFEIGNTGISAVPDPLFYPIISQEFTSALKQLGTLGGGNHFIEIQKGSDGYIWVMIHSGSRNLGYKVAKHYNKVAQDLCTKWYSNIPKIKGEDGLAFLPLDSEEGEKYICEMNYCLEFAYKNRLHMLENIKEAFLNVVDCTFESEINIHHNYAVMENHFGQNVMIHRKGATSAKEGELGIIPGSQGTASYIVKGKGNIESFMSCSHGAGRKMSRKKAREELNLEEEQKKLDEQGILHAIRYKNNLDEASSAYKDIDVVMEEQKDLVDIVVKLKPLAVVKG
jgi:tRNA-splicing ligase RtcB